MKRDMDLVRRILLAAEDQPAGHSASSWTIAFDDVESGVVAEHVQLLHERGLVEASFIGGVHPVAFQLFRVTWDGHEYLDAIRSESVWSETKSTIISKGGALTFELIKAVATSVMRQHLGLGPG